MKVAVMFALAVLLVGGIVIFLYDPGADSPASVVESSDRPVLVEQELTFQDDAIDAGSKGLTIEARLDADPGAMELKALEQESEILELAAEYDVVRADPTQRQDHQKLMKEKLAAYSETVLPVILEKANASAEADQ
jgi:hypothetical protein